MSLSRRSLMGAALGAGVGAGTVLPSMLKPGTLGCD